MVTISRLSHSLGAGSSWLGEALLSLSFLRLGITRSASVEDLPDHLRRDVGLAPRERGPLDPRDLLR